MKKKTKAILMLIGTLLSTTTLLATPQGRTIGLYCRHSTQGYNVVMYMGDSRKIVFSNGEGAFNIGENRVLANESREVIENFLKNGDLTQLQNKTITASIEDTNVKSDLIFGEALKNNLGVTIIRVTTLSPFENRRATFQCGNLIKK